ncbi:response regulator [Amygdalobacter nucleatus]|uniref:response regulator n=1 Tax=Amygdalobacter nucleatus TaxID=3029274 RepID=UPI0027A710C4|nr:response regulator transcription factor [Amygdalobacter nucleatus]WEG36461.1 response regulator transcription factor [Amygdalobacter nucleatus]
MRILIADDDKLVTQGIKTIIEATSQKLDDPIKVIALAYDGLMAVELYLKHKPDLALMDIRMPAMDGIEAGRKILESDPSARLLYLTTFLEDDYIIEALRMGAKGYLLKTDFDSLLPAILAVKQGQSVYGNAISEKLPNLLQSTTNSKVEAKSVELASLRLTNSERQIIYCVANGLSNKEIAAELHFSEGTIRNYLSQILEKLELRDRTQLAIFYYKVLKDGA